MVSGVPRPSDLVASSFSRTLSGSSGTTPETLRDDSVEWRSVKQCWSLWV